MNRKEFRVEKNITIINLLKNEGFKVFSIQKMLKDKDVKVNGVRKNMDMELDVGDKVECFYKDESCLKEKYSQNNIKKIYEDDNIAIVVKPIGINSCGGEGDLESLLGLVAVHRLDTNTAGLIIFAKNQDIKERFVDIFRENKIEKKYICEVVGDSNFDGKVYNAYIFKDAKVGKSFVSKDAKSGYQKIATRFKTIKHGQVSSLVECELITGKTHQIRAHLAYLKHPIVGDKKYGNGKTNMIFKEKTQKLHCFCVKFKEIDDEKLSYLSNRVFKDYPTWWGGKNE